MNLHSFSFPAFKNKSKNQSQKFQTIQYENQMLDSVEEEKAVTSPFCGLELYLNVISVFGFVLFFSTVPISVVMDSYPITCLLLILNHSPNTTIWIKNSSVSHMSKICEFQLSDLLLQLSRLLRKELLLDRKLSSHKKASVG